VSRPAARRSGPGGSVAAAMAEPPAWDIAPRRTAVPIIDSCQTELIHRMHHR
jgi:hypothetical protein